MIYLGTRAVGRDNNLNLIRMIAASAVLVSHAFPISQGAGTPEPLSALWGYTLGTVAVFVFFAISGFLITASFERSSSQTSFLLARGLRLFPGLIVSLLLTAFVLGPVVTTLSPGAYFGQADPYLFVLRNSALFPLDYDLPGVFEDQPYTDVVGSIWTLRHEVMCYMGVFLAGVLGLWRRRLWGSGALLAFGAVWAALTLADVALHPLLRGLLGLAIPFAIGVAFYLWRDHLPLSLLGVAGTALLAWATAHSWVYPLTFALAVAYATFWLAYMPRGPLHAYNHLGDYSYGIYVYAFPLQGAAVWAFGPQSPLLNMIYALPPTLLLAILSWHLVEAPAMRMKDPILTRMGKKDPQPQSPRGA